MRFKNAGAGSTGYSTLIVAKNNSGALRDGKGRVVNPTRAIEFAIVNQYGQVASPTVTLNEEQIQELVHQLLAWAPIDNSLENPIQMFEGNI